MCLYIKQDMHPRPAQPKPKCIIAKEDITCYKVVRRDSTYKKSNKKKQTFYSYVQRFKYILGKTYTTTLDVQGVDGNFIVERGLHSYMTLQIAKSNQGYDGTILKCIIPKGSRVYYGRREELASNKLKTIRVIQ